MIDPLVRLDRVEEAPIDDGSAQRGDRLEQLRRPVLFGKGIAKSSAPGAILIQFIGGIHEIYFPYVLMKPILVLAVMAGGTWAAG